jgi:hypothetical protein
MTIAKPSLVSPLFLSTNSTGIWGTISGKKLLINSIAYQLSLFVFN